MVNGARARAPRAAARKRRGLPAIGIAVLLAFALVPALLGLAPAARAITLAEAYALAGSQGEYDRYLVLETGVVYHGGLLIGKLLDPVTHTLVGPEGADVCIVGNGAILDLQGEQLSISYCSNRLDISDCVIVNGNIRYRGINTVDWQEQPIGSVRYCTFHRPHDYGVRMQGSGDGILVERNIAVDAIDTGWDYIYTTGISNDWLPTGANFAPSVQIGFYGEPVIRENWSCHTDPIANADIRRHFVFL
jgi:hypothetical protein